MTGQLTTTILVVDDDLAVRSAAARLIEGAGYRVIQVASAEEAIGVLDTDRGPIDALVTDIVLGGMNGPALARRVRSRHPEVAVVYLSGYAEQSGGSLDLSELGLEGTEILLAKPFTAESLIGAVRGELDARAAPRRAPTTGGTAPTTGGG